MQVLAAAPRMREWWDIMEAMQIPVAGRASGEWWANMKEVFHFD
jgi:L-rhamnose mutarotase